MSNYSQVTSFGPKDSLLTGDPNKVARGAQIDTELSLIATAIASKVDSTGFGDGTQAAPSIAFSSDTDTGLWRLLSGTIGVSCNNTNPASFGPSGCYFLMQAGSAASPGLAFFSDPDCGLYRIGANNLGVSVNGAKVLDVATTGLSVTGTIFPTGVIGAIDGTAGLPGYTFVNDSGTGLYRIGANNLGIAVAGTKIVDIAATTFQVFGANVGFLETFQNPQPANYTLVLSDSGRHIYHASGAGAGDTYTIPANASVAFPVGTTLTFVNADSNSVSIAITSDTMTLANTTTTGTRTLAQNGIAFALKIGTTSWLIYGFGLS